MKLMTFIYTAFILCFTLTTYAQADRIIISEEKSTKDNIINTHRDNIINNNNSITAKEITIDNFRIMCIFLYLGNRR